MKAKIKLVDGIATVAIPASILSSAGLSPGDEISVYVENGQVVLVRLGASGLADRLIDDITSANLHREIGTDGPVGNEAF